MNAWAYLVVSSDQQAETLADQEKWATATASTNGWQITRTFSDVATGKRGVRALLVRLLSELKATPGAERPQWVLMIRLDRVGRGSVLESQIALHELRSLGVKIWTRDQGEVALDSAMGEMIASIMLGVAKIENDVRSDKAKAFHARKRAAGEFSGIPGFGFVTLEKKLVPYEPEAALVRKLYELRVAGWGIHRLARYAAERAPAKTLVDGTKRPLRWAASTITRLIANRSYRGPIVDAALWDDAVSIRRGGPDRWAPRWPWPLRGAIRCKCGLLLSVAASGKKQHRLRYYVCRRTAEHGRYPYHNAERMEAQFVALLGRLEADDSMLRYKPPPASIEPLRARKADLTCSLAKVERRLVKVWELAEDGTIPKRDLAERLRQLEAEREQVASALQSAERELAGVISHERNDADIAAVLAALPSLWPLLEVSQCRDVARAVAAYLGGLWADPDRPHVLLIPGSSGPDGDDVRGRKCENMRPDASAMLRLPALLEQGRKATAD